MPTTKVLGVALAVLAVACGTEDPGGPGPGPDPVTHPTFVITSPARGGMIQAGALDPMDITIVGQVCDTVHPVTALTLNGVAIPVTGATGCVPFSVPRASRWGLTILSGEARNSQGNVTRLAQSFLRGAAYLPPAEANNAAAAVENGMFAHLPQALIDDFDRSSVDDLATLASLILTATNWTGAVPNPMAVSPDVNGDGAVDTQTYECLFQNKVNQKTGYRVTHGTLNSGTITTQMMVVPDGGGALRVNIRLAGVSLPVTVRGYLDLLCVGNPEAAASGHLVATAIDYSATMTPAVVDGVFRFHSTNRSVQFQGLALNVDFTDFEFIDHLVGSIVSSTVNAFDAGLVNYLLDEVSPQLDELVNGVFPREVIVTLGGFSAVSRPDTIGFRFQPDAMRVGMAAQAWPTGVRPGPAPARGALRKDGAVPTFAGGAAFGLGTAVKDDFVNQFFWAAWRSGAFDLSSVSALGCDATLPGATLATFAELPPVLMGGPGDSVALGLGDIRLTGTVNGKAVVAYASGIVRGTLGAASNALTFTGGPDAEVAVQVVSIDDSTALEQLRAALPPFLRCVVNALTIETLEQLPLVEFPVTDVPGVPGGTVWRVGDAVVGREGNYTTLRGTVQ